MSTNFEEISFDPSFMDSETGQEEQKVEELDLFNDDFLGLKKEEKETIDQDKKLEEEDIDDEDVPSHEDIKEKSSNLFSVVLGQDLVEKGILSSFEQEEIAKIATEQGESAALEHMFKKQTEFIESDLRNAYDKNYQEYLTMIQGGVPKEEAMGILQVETFAESLKSVDLKSEEETSVSARKDLLTLHYRLSTKFSEDKIQKLIDKMYDEGSDIEEVDEALANVNSYIAEEKQNSVRNAEEQKIQAQKGQEKWVNDLKNHVEKTEEYFTGIKVTKQVKDQMIKSLTTPVKLDDGQVVAEIWAERTKDPVKFDSGIAYLKAIGYFDGKPLDKFIKTAQTKATSKLDEFLNDNKGRSYMNGMGKGLRESGKQNVVDRALFGE